MYTARTARSAHQGVICCFDPETGTPIALMDGAHVTAARSTAGSALARAVARIRAVQRLRIAGRDAKKVELLVSELRADDLPAEAASSIVDAVRTADVVCATTHASEPVVRRAWLRPGTHVTSVGYKANGRGEVDVETVRDTLLFVESRAAVLAPPPSGAVELRNAIAEGLVTDAHIHAEIGEVVTNGKGRTDAAQITLYKSVGVAVQDAAAAAVVPEERASAWRRDGDRALSSSRAAPIGRSRARRWAAPKHDAGAARA